MNQIELNEKWIRIKNMIRPSESKIKNDFDTPRESKLFFDFWFTSANQNSRIEINRFGPSPGCYYESLQWLLRKSYGKIRLLLHVSTVFGHILYYFETL